MQATLGQCAEWAEADLQGPAELAITSVFADSRLCRPGSLFVAIQGPNLDGQEFLEDARQNGAVAALVRDAAVLGEGPGLVAPDTIAALGRLAHGFRRTLEIPWVAITGSNGKTTTRELLTRILAGAGPVVSSLRNYNNNIGVPLSILSAPQNPWAGVIEIGSSGPGEVQELARLVEPSIGIITSVGRAHLEGFGSPEAVAQEKGSLLAELPAEGLGVFPAETAHRDLLESLCAAGERRRFTAIPTEEEEVGADIQPADFREDAEGIHFTAWEVSFDLRLHGRHNAGNALAAVAVADRLGVTPAAAAERLREVPPVAGRLQLREIGPVRVLDDTYNANPDSLAAATEVLCRLPAKRRVAIVGAMGELGEESAALHRECGTLLARAGVDLVMAAGVATVELSEAAATSSASCRVHYFPSVKALLSRLSRMIEPGDLVLVKGSRAAQMERVVGRLERLFGAGSERRRARSHHA